MTNVLVIDDDDEVRDFLVRLLKRRGYSVTAARNGESGLASLAAESFALVITDIVMPDMEGLETIKRIRRGNPALPIIAISGGGSSQIDYLKFARKFGADAALAKPFDPAELLDLATQLIA
jgi:two-component system, chemotaxis family, chemotaxis protein CheY